MARPMILARNGWYPSSKEECKIEIENFVDKSLKFDGQNPISCVVPHAGWYYCGIWAINAIRLLKENTKNIKNVVVFGGHLSPSDKPILETFDNAQTPFGLLPNNKDVIEFLRNEKNIEMEDFIHDNTIEVLLPIVKYYFNDCKITAIYMPPNEKTIGLAQKLYDKFHEGTVFIGSTDLTHYGPNYGFYHNDNSIGAVDWVKKVNDKKFVDALIEMKGEEALAHAVKNHAACSSGAALASLSVAKQAGMKKGNLIGYSTSYDVQPNSSFVGYVGIIW